MCFGKDESDTVLSREAADNVREKHTAVYHRITALLGEYVDGMGDGTKKVVEFATPEELLQIFYR